MREPWTGYHEFHVLNDLLVIYYQVDAKKRLRMVTITNHKELLVSYEVRLKIVSFKKITPNEQKRNIILP
ncbi:type II toxin-antitoxin system YafQ family toxin [Lactobacillus sp. R2/2]|nr:type II toxin-antitoxin system YafQ family toxin [Lactobacillus sp. R2/2]